MVRAFHALQLSMIESVVVAVNRLWKMNQSLVRILKKVFPDITEGDTWCGCVRSYYLEIAH